MPKVGRFKISRMLNKSSKLPKASKILLIWLHCYLKCTVQVTPASSWNRNSINLLYNEFLSFPDTWVSVTGLGDFWKLFIANFLTIVSQTFGYFLGLFEEHIFCYLGIFWKFGQLFILTSRHTAHDEDGGGRCLPIFIYLRLTHFRSLWKGKQERKKENKLTLYSKRGTEMDFLLLEKAI